MRLMVETQSDPSILIQYNIFGQLVLPLYLGIPDLTFDVSSFAVGTLYA